MAFTGFSEDSLKFLARLKRNNKREWFQPRKDEYVRLLVEPMQEFLAELHRGYGSQMPELIFDPKKAIYRIYRDTRFSNDKTPYKTHIGAFLPWRGTSKSDPEAPGIYIQVNTGGLEIYGGTWGPSTMTLRKIREQINRDTDNFLDLLERPKKKFGSFEGEKLKKAPQGTDPNHPLIEYLRHKQFYFVHKIPKSKLGSKKLVKLVGDNSLEMMPMTRWLQKASKIW